MKGNVRERYIKQQPYPQWHIDFNAFYVITFKLTTVSPIVEQNKFIHVSCLKSDSNRYEWNCL